MLDMHRDLEEIMAEGGVSVDHSSLNRWVIRYSPQLAWEARNRKRPVAGPWKMDEAYLRVKGEWVYLYRAIDEFGDTVDFMLSEKRDEAAATALFRQTIDGNSLPEKAVIDKSGSNNAGLENINMLLILAGIFCWTGILQVKYLNNRIEQDHRYIKKFTKLMIGFKAVISNRPGTRSSMLCVSSAAPSLDVEVIPKATVSAGYNFSDQRERNLDFSNNTENKTSCQK